MSGGELVERADGSLVPRDASPLEILADAVQRGSLDAESLERLSGLAERWEDRRARQAFADAMHQFHGECPEIHKSRRATFATKSGSQYGYDYAPLEEIARVVTPILYRLGLSYSWDSSTNGEEMTVVCRLRHVQGHEESASFACSTRSSSPGMSGAQQAASAMSFARRQSLTAVLGLTTVDPDEDGADPTPITAHEASFLRSLAEQVGVDEAQYFKWLGVASYEEIRARDFRRATAGLQARRGR